LVLRYARPNKRYRIKEILLYRRPFSGAPSVTSLSFRRPPFNFSVTARRSMLVIESPSKMQNTASTPSLEDIKALEQTRQRLQAVVTHLGQIQAQLAQTDPLPNWYVLLCLHILW
jgi:hypothetical protein